MSRIPKWKIEKAKVKVVFRLQFSATNVPQGWDKLFISFIPYDTEKVTAKTTKANVRNGSCKWSDPIYETAKLLQHPTTKIYDEKLYKIVVAMGTSHASLLGEVYINLADYVDPINPSSVSLPLEGCDFGTILHVNIQPLSSKTGFREFELQRERNDRRSQMVPGQKHRESNRVSLAAHNSSDQPDKVKAKQKADSLNFVSIEGISQLNESYEDSVAGLDGSSNTSGSLYTEKISSLHDIEGVQETSFPERSGFPLDQHTQSEKGDQHDTRLFPQGSVDWTHGWSSDYSGDNDLANACEENDKLKLEKAELIISQLKLQASSLQTLLLELGAETQILATKLTSELSFGKELSREVSLLKSECLKMKTDVAESEKYVISGLQKKWLRGLSIMEFTIRAIQNKVCSTNQGCDLGLYSEFDVLKNVFDDLGSDIASGASFEMTRHWHQKEAQLAGSGQAGQLLPNIGMGNAYGEFHHPRDVFHLGGVYKEQHQHISVKNNSNSTLIEDKICELLNEIEKCKSEKEGITMKMGQMECYYESLIQELETSHKHNEIELEKLKVEHGSCLYTIATLEGQLEKMQKGMKEQHLKFAEERNALDSLIKSLEKRATASESALKRVRWNYSIAVDRLQKDLELLSFQVLSMYETNQSLAKQAFTDASEFCFKYNHAEYADFRSNENGHPAMVNGMLKKVDHQHAEDFLFVQEGESISKSESLMSAMSVKHDYMNGQNLDSVGQLASKSNTIQNLSHVMAQADQTSDAHRGPNNNKMVQSQRTHTDHNVVGKASLEDLRTLCMQNAVNTTPEAPISDAHVLILDVEVYCMVLQESLRHVVDESREMKRNMEELAQQIEQSALAKESLMLRVQDSCNEAGMLKDNEAKHICRCDELAFRNQALEADLQAMAKESAVLTQRAAEYEKLISGFLVQESKFGSCDDESLELKLLLEHEKEEKASLQREISSVMEEFKALKEEFSNQTLLKDDLQNALICIQEKLKNMHASIVGLDGQVNSPAFNELCRNKEMGSENYKDIIMYLQKFQQEIHKKIFDLQNENQVLKVEWDSLKFSIGKADSESMGMKKKYESELQDLASQLSSSNASSKKLALELKDVQGKLEVSMQAVEMHKLESTEFSLQILNLKGELQHVSEVNKDLLVVVEKVKEELEMTKSSLASCMLEKGTMLELMQSRDEYVIQMENELSSLKQSLKTMEEERDMAQHSLENADLLFMNMKQKLESDVQELTSNLSSSNSSLEKLVLELQDAKEKLDSSLEVKEIEKLRNKDLSSRLVNLETELQHATEKNNDLVSKVMMLDDVSKELERTKSNYVKCLQENESLILSIQSKDGLIVQLEHEHSSLKESLSFVSDELQLQKDRNEKLESDVQELTSKLSSSNSSLEKVVLELQDVKEKLGSSLEVEEMENLRNKDLSSRLVNMEIELQHATEKNNDLVSKVMLLDDVSKELERTKSNYVRCLQENESLILSTQSKDGLIEQLEHELSSFKESLSFVSDELQFQRDRNNKLELASADLTLQLKEKSDQLITFDEKHAELVNLRQKVSDLELQLSDGLQVLDLNKSSQSASDCRAASLSIHLVDLESLLALALEHFLIFEVQFTYTRSELDDLKQDFVNRLEIAKKKLTNLDENNVEVLDLLHKSIGREAELADKSKALSTALQAAKSELEIIVNERNNLVEHVKMSSTMQSELRNLKSRYLTVEVETNREKQSYEKQISQLESMLVNFEREIDHLRCSRDELDVTNVILKSKLDEQQPSVSLLEDCDVEIRKLRDRNNELSYKLSEQIMKTEEFKNLSIHLRELKDKAEAERQQAREKKESFESSSLAVQESLRIALIKEQCEIKVQDLNNQLVASKKHAEEMLLKLQSTLDELENGKKIEISLTKTNEELSTRISDLEKELQMVATDRRELVKAYDRMKAELECTILSLDCFKEEKVKLEASLQECNEERTKVRAELDLVKRLLENMASIASNEVRDSFGHGIPTSTSIGQILDENSPNTIGSSARRSSVTEDPKLDCDKSSHSCSKQNIEMDQPPDNHLEDETLSENSSRRITKIKEDAKEKEQLKAEMDRLCKELDRLKNENLDSLISPEDQHLDLALEGLERELTQLERANEHLGSLYPSFGDINGNGNALERVLALELELAESLQMRNKPTPRFQSSFLKQHNDEAAVFQSFKDINDLIKEMLELKKKNANFETELKEMHGRYSQLSLQFAEVEGERQKLLMTVKNRSPRKS